MKNNRLLAELEPHQRQILFYLVWAIFVLGVVAVTLAVIVSDQNRQKTAVIATDSPVNTIPADYEPARGPASPVAE